MPTDQLADLITRIRNGYLARKLLVTVPHSKLKEAVVRVLAEYDLVGDIKIEKKDKVKKEMTIYLNYDEKGRPVVEHIARLSKPGLRKYWKACEIPVVRGGFGIAVLSTNKGVVSSERAREEGVGGEALIEVW